jgi:RNA polymerase-interacting CarD/CdnL/TRCF family regulator
VVRKSKREFGGPSREYYEIAIPTGTVWVPVEGTPSGLRKLTEKGDLGRYRGLLSGRPKALASDNKERKNALLERMKDSSMQARCEVLRDLAALGWDKPLNESISSLWRTVRQLLGAEWAAADGLTFDDALLEVDALLAKGKKAYR